MGSWIPSRVLQLRVGVSNTGHITWMYVDIIERWARAHISIAMRQCSYVNEMVTQYVAVHKTV